MKKLVTMILLLTCSLAFADNSKWIYTAENDAATYYVMPARSASANPREWALINYKTPLRMNGGRTFLSTVALHEYNCTDFTSRIVSLTSYERHWQQGTATPVDAMTLRPLSNFEPSPPGSIVANNTERMCK